LRKFDGFMAGHLFKIMSELESQNLSCLSNEEYSIAHNESHASNSSLNTILQNLPENLDESLKLSLFHKNSPVFPDTETSGLSKTKKLLNFDWKICEKPLKKEDLSESKKLKVSETASSVKSPIKYREDFVNSVSYAPNKLFCPECFIDVFTIVKFQEVPFSMWHSFNSFFNQVTCCGSSSLETQEEVVHMCSKCFRILLKIVH